MTVLPPMNDPDKVEQLVSAHLQKALDGQRGRAMAAFREQINCGGVPNMPRSFEEEKRKMMRSLRIWAGAAAAMAACLAVVVTLQRSPGDTENPSVVAPQQVSVPIIDQVELSRNVDAGTQLLPDQTPVRVVKQQTLKQTRWFDESERATYEITEPVERVGYERIQPY